MSYTSEISFDYVTPSQTIAAGAVLPAVGLLLVPSRFYVRRLQQAPPGLDDWLSAAALVTCLFRRSVGDEG